MMEAMKDTAFYIVNCCICCSKSRQCEQQFLYQFLLLCFLAAEIIMIEGLTCVYRSNVDLYFYVVGSAQENEVSHYRAGEAVTVSHNL